MRKLGVGVVGVGEMGRRHAENLRIRELWVRPRLDSMRSLERFESEAQNVEERNCFEFVERFELSPDHPHLNDKRDEEQQIVAWDASERQSRNNKNRDEEEASK